MELSSVSRVRHVACAALLLLTGCAANPEKDKDGGAGGAGDAGWPACCVDSGGTGGGPPAVDASVDDAGVIHPCADCTDGRIVLASGWSLQSSAGVQGAGAEISSPGYSADGWYPVTVPSTVLAGLVANNVFPDPYVGDNLKLISPSLFDVSWWYRTEFVLPDDAATQAYWLALDGINFRANVWLNGQLVASSSEVAGTFTGYEWNITPFAKAGQTNALAIEVFRSDYRNTLAIYWMDWNPQPPDNNMGIWQDVYLKKSGSVALRNTHVTSQVALPSLDSAKLTVKTDVRNTTAKPVHATVRGTIGSIELSQEVDVSAGETKTVVFDPSQNSALDLKSPRLWWPAQMGAQDQYDLVLRAEVDGQTSDRDWVRFGIRDVKFEMEGKYRVYRINGRRMLIRGGGWASDMLLRSSPERLDAELRFVRDLGLNAVRQEGKLETPEFYSRLDDYGIVTLPGWMCCDKWQWTDQWSPDEHRIAIASMEHQAKRLRNHPSVINFLLGSDNAPTDEVQQELVTALTKYDWPNPINASASDTSSQLLGPSGMKMTGPYGWVPPAYWYLSKDTSYPSSSAMGGAFGFNSETGPGAAIPEMESLTAWLSTNDLDSILSSPDAPCYHAGAIDSDYFNNLRRFNEALAARHGAPTSLDDYVKKAQLMNYEAERAEFEAFGRNKYTSATGVIHWMLNNAWPSVIWHLYGNDLSVAAGYFGAKKANLPLHMLYSYDDRSVVVVNHTTAAVTGLQASVRVYNLDATEQFASDAPVDVPDDGIQPVVTIPELPLLSDTYFVKLTLSRGSDVISNNFYWLSRKAEVIDLQQPAPPPDALLTSQYADFSALSQLPTVAVSASVSSDQSGQTGVTHVHLSNESSSIAFFIRLKLTRGRGGEQVLPVLWQDNYITLMPNEERTLTVSYDVAKLGGSPPAIEVSGWNVAGQTLGD